MYDFPLRGRVLFLHTFASNCPSFPSPNVGRYVLQVYVFTIACKDNFSATIFLVEPLSLQLVEKSPNPLHAAVWKHSAELVLQCEHGLHFPSVKIHQKMHKAATNEYMNRMFKFTGLLHL